VLISLSLLVFGVANLAVGEENKRMMGNSKIISTLISILLLNEDKVKEFPSRVNVGFEQSRIYATKVSLMICIGVSVIVFEGSLESVIRS
jgi:hypothetical protein